MWLATDGKWYMVLGIDEDDYDDDRCVVYGPFASEDACHEELDDNHSNPGAYCSDDSGTLPPPENPRRPGRSWSR